MAFLKLISLVFVLAVVLGVILKIFIKSLEILAIPAILGFIFLEQFHNQKWLGMNEPPKNGYLRIIFNISASFISVFSLRIGYYLVNQIYHTDFNLFDLMSESGTNWFICFLILFLVINSLSKKDKSDSLTKFGKYDLKPLVSFFK